MPTAPHHRQIGPGHFDGFAYVQRIADWVARDHAHAQAEGILGLAQHRAYGVSFEASVYYFDLVTLRVQRGTNRDEAQGHRPKDGGGVVEKNLLALGHGLLSMLPVPGRSAQWAWRPLRGPSAEGDLTRARWPWQAG